MPEKTLDSPSDLAQQVRDALSTSTILAASSPTPSLASSGPTPHRPSSLGRALRQALLDAVESLKPSVDLPSEQARLPCLPDPQAPLRRGARGLPGARSAVAEREPLLPRAAAGDRGVSAVLWERWGLGERRGGGSSRETRQRRGKSRISRGGIARGLRRATKESRERPRESPRRTSRPADQLRRPGAGDGRGQAAARDDSAPDAHGHGRLREDQARLPGRRRTCSDEYPDGVWLVELAPARRPLARAADRRARPRGPRGVWASRSSITLRRLPQAEAPPPRPRQLRAPARRLLPGLPTRSSEPARRSGSSRPVASRCGSRARPPGESPRSRCPTRASASRRSSLLEYEAVRLFVERGKAVRPDVRADRAERPCRRPDLLAARRHAARDRACRRAGQRALGRADRSDGSTIASAS